MRRFLLALILGALCLLVGRPAAAQSGPAAEILQRVNQVRADHGLPPYRYNGTLAVAAQNHANWMAANVSYTHTGAGGSSPQDRANAVGYNGYVSENIVGGTGMTPAQGVIWWRNSPIHYRMMVSTRYSEAGVAFATNGTHNMYVLVMGRPAGGVEMPGPEPQSEPLIITPITLAEPREDGSIVHEVEEGQALWQIAAHYEVELDEMMLINGMDEDAILQPGDEVFVRLADDATPPPTPTPPLTHVVREGDNAWIIAARYDVELETIFYLNGLSEDTVLQPGETIKVRLGPGETPPPTATPKLTHVVQEGETLWAIAALNDLTVEELRALNNLSEEAILQPGDELLIRETGTPTPAVTATITTTVAPTGTQAEGDGSADVEAAAPAGDAAVMAVEDSSPAPTPAAATPTPEGTPTPAQMVQADSGSGEPEMDALYLGSLFVAGLGLALLAGLVLRQGQQWP